jgi:hypothetical protein
MQANSLMAKYDYQYLTPPDNELTEEQLEQELRSLTAAQLFDKLSQGNQSHYLGEMFDMIAEVDKSWLKAEFIKELMNGGGSI